ncbi:MAG TPA: FtsX-like permease family protein [Burkholderiaceae bacterium]|jgi:putative ABC transport system permease protein|nr:FtsX-like permease family protein [Burkholderiaceae bacterium]
MKTLSLALRNLLRNRRRSLTTLLAMVIGLVAILIFGGYRSNITYGSQTGFVQGTGHLQIQHKDYFLDGSDNPTAYGIADYQHIIDVVKHDPILAPMLTVVTPILQLGGLAGNFAAGVSRSVIASGVVVEERNQMLSWNDYKLTSYAHQLPLVGTSQDAVVVGTGVARKLRLCNALKVPNCVQAPTVASTDGNQAPDDITALSALAKTDAPPVDDTRIEMLAATAHGAPNVASLSVVQAENMGVKALDDVYLAMHLAQAQKLIYGAAPPQVTAIQIQLQHTNQIPVARKRLEQLLANEFKTEPLEVLDFRQLNPMYGQTVEFMDSMFGFISILIGVIVLFTIGNTMSTAVVERTVEIGTLRAIGLRRSGIRRLFLCEGVLLGVIGAVIGLLCSLAIAYLINHSGMAWTPPGYSYAYLILVRVWQDMNLLVGSVIGLILVTVVSAWWPANRAANMMIVDALRHV